MNAIEAKKLTKKYKDKCAVDGLELSVKEGELFALLGVNGAGKTTTIRMLSCLSEPDEGECFVGGHSCSGESGEVKRLIGVSPHSKGKSGAYVRHTWAFQGGNQAAHYGDDRTFRAK